MAVPDMINDANRDRVKLPDGRIMEFEIRSSAKARSLRLTLGARNGLVVTAPQGLDRQRVLRLVADNAEWISGRLSSFDAIRHLINAEPAERPEAFNLQALAETWRVEYKATRSSTVGARMDQPGRIVVAGAVDDVAGCHAALRRWLARHAANSLPPWLENLSAHTGLQFADLAIKNQRTRWGSCSPSGRISLNCKLLFLPRELVRYVMVHELCHLETFNHSKQFWAHLRQVEPEADSLHGRMQDSWKFVPAWAQRGNGALL